MTVKHDLDTKKLKASEYKLIEVTDEDYGGGGGTPSSPLTSMKVA